MLVLQLVISDILEEEQEDFDSLPPGPQASPIGQEMEEAIDMLEPIDANLSDALGEIAEFLRIKTPNTEAQGK